MIKPHPDYQRIATEEAFAPKEMFDIYRKILAGKDPDPGFVSLLGFYMSSQSDRARHIIRCLSDLDQVRLGHMERAEMQTALDHIAVQLAGGEAGQAVRAGIVGRVEPAIDVVEGNRATADLESTDSINRHIADAADEVFGLAHRHHRMKLTEPSEPNSWASSRTRRSRISRPRSARRRT